MQKKSIISRDFDKLRRQYADPLNVAVEMQRLHYGKKLVGPTPAQTLDDKIKEMEVMGFTSKVLEVLTKTCHRVHGEMVASGKKPKLAIREIGERIRCNLPMVFSENPVRTSAICDKVDRIRKENKWNTCDDAAWQYEADDTLGEAIRCVEMSESDFRKHFWPEEN